MNDFVNLSDIQIMHLALLGGLFSLISTSIGGFLILLSPHISRFKLSNFRLSIDFALGIMLSAVAFSLFGPELLQSLKASEKLTTVLAGFSLGILFIGWTHSFIHSREKKAESQIKSSHVVLALALIFHNFPEGMGAGASLAGMSLIQALPIQVAIAIQNLPEGLILAICLKGFGWSTAKAIWGSIGSGFIELSGAVIAGFALQQSMTLLPFLLSLAGGAMLMSVGIELVEAAKNGRLIQKYQLLIGLFTIPLLNLILGM